MKVALKKTIVVSALSIGIASLSLTPVEARKPGPAVPGASGVRNLAEAAKQTAAIVEGTVVAVENDYSDTTDAWTKITLSDLKTHRGSVSTGAEPKTITILQRGGEAPGGVLVRVSHISNFTIGERYILFLRNTAWNMSPYVGAPLRVAQADGKQFLVEPGQRPLVSVSSSQLVFSRDPIFRDKDAGRGVSPTQRNSGFERRPTAAVPASAMG